MPDPNSHIQAHKAELHTLCRTYGVERLALFGSGPSEIEFVEYERDLMVRSAVERQFEIVGEALEQAAQESDAIMDEIPAIPRIVALRNQVIHGYDSVDNEIVWDIVQTKVPPLMNQSDRVLNEEE